MDKVEIVFDTKDMSSEEIEEFIKEYTDSEFAIIKVERDSETNETIVVIKFVDKDADTDFVRTVDESKPEHVKKTQIIESSVSFSSPTFSSYLFQKLLCLY